MLTKLLLAKSTTNSVTTTPSPSFCSSSTAEVNSDSQSPTSGDESGPCDRATGRGNARLGARGDIENATGDQNNGTVGLVLVGGGVVGSTSCAKSVSTTPATSKQIVNLPNLVTNINGWSSN